MIVPDSAVTAGVGAISAAIAAAITHFLSRPKQDADVHATIAAGAGAAVDTISDVLEHLRVELDQARQEIAKLREENKALRASITSLNAKIDQLQKVEQVLIDEGRSRFG